MANETTCLKCNARLGNDARRGFCPQCLIVQAGSRPIDPASWETEVDDSVSAIEAAEDLPRKFGEYELLQEVGRGGMGVVYKARQCSLDRLVAVKMLLFGPLASPELVKRFQAEATAAACLLHPNIVAIHQIGVHNRQQYFTMDFVEGDSLAKILLNGRLTAIRAATYLKTVAEAIHFAHERGILHRDLKPSNVLIDTNDQPRVTDFGLARRLHGDSELTVTGQILGSPNYMPPEQAAGRHGQMDCRSDVYSLGAMLYHLLSGRPPFVSETLTGTLQQVLHAEVISPRLFHPNLPRDLETICLKCLEKEPSRRYSTAEELAQELGRFLHDEPIRARPAGGAEKLWRWSRRRPLIAFLGAATLFLLLVLAIGSPIALVRIDRERQRAQNLSEKQIQLRRQADRRAYAADMKLAQSALEMNKVGSVLSLLNRYKPKNESPSPNQTSEVDFRGWEWRYLWNQCQSDADSILCKATDQVMSLSISHDGAWLALGVSDTGVSVRDRTTGDEIARLPSSGHMVRVAFSPTEMLLAYTDVPSYGSASTNYSVHLWDGIRRRLVKTLPLSYLCYGVAFSDDGRTLVTSTQNRDNHPLSAGLITLWRVSDWTVVTNYAAPQLGMVEGTSFALAPDLSIAAHQTENDKVRLIDLTTGSQLWKSGQTTDDYVTALAFSPDKKILASGAGSADSVIRLWDVASGREIRKLEGHRAGIDQLLFFPDGRTLASASVDSTIRLWDVTDAANAHLRKTLQGHRSRLRSLAFLPGANLLASGSADGTVCLWNTIERERHVKRFTLPEFIGAWRLTPDGRSVIAGIEDENGGAVGQWSIDTDFRKMERLLNVGTNLVDDACFSEDCRWLAVSYPGGGVQVWDLPNRHLSSQFNAQMRRVATREFSADGKRLFLLSDKADNSLHEWDLTPGNEMETRMWRLKPGRGTYALSPDRNWFVSSILNPDSGTVTSLTDLKNGRRMDLRLPWFRAAAFSPDSQLFALGGWTTDVRLFETATGREVTRLRGVLSQVWGLAFSPDGRRFLTGGGGSETLTLWDTQSFEKLLILEGTGSACDQIGFSPDGNTIAARTERGVLHLWRAPSWTEIDESERTEIGEYRTPSNSQGVRPISR